MSKALSTIEVNPPTGNPPNGTVIILHGLGADGHDFVPLVEHLSLLNEHYIRFIFPHAPKRTVTVNKGMEMRAWYDIHSLEFLDTEDEAGIVASNVLLTELLEKEEARGVPSDRIYLGGFSQGGAMSLFTGLRYPRPLGGILALSTYLPLPKRLAKERNSANQAVPIFQVHGLFDPVVPLHLGQACHERLSALGYSVEWHTYSMPHAVIPEEIVHIRTFLHRNLHG